MIKDTLDSAAIDALAQQYQAGEREAIAALWEHLHCYVAQAVAYYRTRPGLLPGCIEPGDLENQSFLILVDILASWQAQGSFVAYFLALYRKRLVGYLREQSRQPVSWAHIVVVARLDARAVALDGVERLILDTLLDDLPPLLRQALNWRYLDDLTAEQVEQRHGVRPNTFRQRCLRGLRLLRTKVAAERQEQAA